MKQGYCVRLLFFLTGLLPMLYLSSCQRELHFAAQPANHTLALQFQATVDNDTLVFGNTYANAFNEPYTVKTFEFYIHNIQLINTDSGITYTVTPDKYFLVNFGDPGSIAFSLPVTSGTFNRIAFTVGVDSALNVSGAQTGALDPANGMFWTWNSGYIMAKLEGNSPVSTDPDNIFEYHIGGFRTGENVIKKVTLSFPLSENIDLMPGKTTDMTITANVNAWFNNPTDIRISAIPACTTPGTLATEISQNYSKMFTVVNVINQ